MNNEVKANDGKTYALPKKPVWRKGPPPEIGWWPADHEIDRDAITRLRHWDGEHWSIFSWPRESGFDGRFRLRAKRDICWTDRWWLNQPKGFPK
jgi:hypothetical protein